MCKDIIYVDLCDNLRMFSILENTKDIKKKINNRKIKEVVNFFLLFKYRIYTYFNKIKKIEFENKIIYVVYINKAKKCKNNKLDNIVFKTLKNKNCKVIFSQELVNILHNSKKNKDYINMQKQDKTIFIENIQKALEYIIKIRKECVQQNNIYVLTKNNNIQYRNLLIDLSLKYKSLNIITEKIKEFKHIEDFVYEKYGVFVVISNNKRKSLIRAKYILNIDYNENEINQFNINRNGIIFNISNNEIKRIRGFNGIIINNVEMEYISGANYEHIKYSRKQKIFRRFQNNMEENNLEPDIINIVGNNGYIAESEVKKSCSVY